MKSKEIIYEYIVGDQLDIETIMKEYTNYIYTVIINRANNLKQEDIEEIISDVFLILWNNKNKLDVDKRLSPYIAGITKNLIKKKYRTVKEFEDIEDFEEHLIINEKINDFSEIEEKNDILINELKKMKTEDKKIFMMFYYESKKIKEIANILNISESKIKSKLSRFRKKFNKQLERRRV